jgi:nicotinate-nucleotide adenylyltransferase
MSLTPNLLSQPPLIRAYLGGSFDPVHCGHLQMAMAVYNHLILIADQRPVHVALLPNARSPFKDKSSAAKQRLAMLELAVADSPLEICTHELWQAPPVYTIDTVKALRKRYPDDTLIFIMGADSVTSLPRWKQGLELTDYVHLWVFDRYSLPAQTNDSKLQGETKNKTQTKTKDKTQAATTLATSPIKKALVPTELQEAKLIADLPDILQARSTADPKDLLIPPIDNLKIPLNGRIYRDKTAIAAISSTQVRQAIAAGASDTLTTLLPPTVAAYIEQHQLYSE